MIRLTAAQKTGEPSQTDGELTIAFYPNGTCDGGVLWLQGREKRDAITLVLDPVTAKTTPLEPGS
jgi:Cft2 family RNA processing exonuclease